MTNIYIYIISGLLLLPSFLLAQCNSFPLKYYAAVCGGEVVTMDGYPSQFWTPTPHTVYNWSASGIGITGPTDQRFLTQLIPVNPNAQTWNTPTYFCQVQDTVSGCTGTIAFYYYIYGFLPTPIHGPDTVLCGTGGNFVYIAPRWSDSPGGFPETINWSATGGTVQSVTTSQWLYPNYDTVVVNWSSSAPVRRLYAVKNIQGWPSNVAAYLNCTRIDTLEIYTGVPRIQGPVNFCKADTLTYYSQGDSLTWSISGGTFIGSPTGSSVQVVWSTGGLLSTQSPSGQCGTSDSLQVSFQAAAPVFGADTSLCNNPTLVLYAGPGFSYQWAGLANNGAQVTVTAPGSYAVTVEQFEGCRVSDTIVVSRAAQPRVDLGADSTFCDTVSGSLDAGFGYATFQWSNAANTQMIVPSGPGSYGVTATDSVGCSSADTVQWSVVATPAPNLGPDSTQCGTNPVTLAVPPGNNVQWSTGANSNSIQVTTGGSYSVQVTNGAGCKGLDTVAITFFPEPSLSIGADQDFCAGGSAVFSASGFSSYLWSTGDTTAFANISFSTPVWLTVTDSNGCTARDTATATMQPSPSANFTYSQNGNVLTFSNTSTGVISNYHWDFGDGDTSGLANPVHTFPWGATYWVCLSVSGDCADTVCLNIPIPVSVSEPVKPTFVVYPVPAGDLLHVDFEAPLLAEVQFELHGADGRRLLVPQVSGSGPGVAVLDISGLSMGAYWLRLSWKGGAAVRPFFKQ